MERKYQIHAGLTTEEDDDATFVTLADGSWALLEGTAQATWALLDEPQTLESIVSELSSRYNGPSDRIQSDVASILEDWVRLGIADQSS